ncbi:hypothetical protein Hanom_Chr02g00113501 [Helianthus anomalus]
MRLKHPLCGIFTFVQYGHFHFPHNRKISAGFYGELLDFKPVRPVSALEECVESLYIVLLIKIFIIMYMNRRFSRLILLLKFRDCYQLVYNHVSKFVYFFFSCDFKHHSQKLAG